MTFFLETLLEIDLSILFFGCGGRGDTSRAKLVSEGENITNYDFGLVFVKKQSKKREKLTKRAENLRKSFKLDLDLSGRGQGVQKTHQTMQNIC